MKVLALLFIFSFFVSACQRYIIVSIPRGSEIHLQGRQLSVGDSIGHFRVYQVRDAYKKFNRYNEIERLLQGNTNSSQELGMVHTQPTKKYMQRMNKLYRKKEYSRALAKRD